ncbi:UNVERIFIED_CONTAM: Farnesol kinase, chloroplastic [Sesamum indicum]
MRLQTTCSRTYYSKGTPTYQASTKIPRFQVNFPLLHFGYIPLVCNSGSPSISRDLVQATLAYVLSIAFTTVFYWRTPLAIAVICSLCAGDGVADIAGRRFGGSKLPYNKSKTFAGSFGMALAAFLASLLYMYYFSWLEYIEIEATPNMVLGFFLVSVASALVESFPFSPTLDDNLTVPLASFMLATFLL